METWAAALALARVMENFAAFHGVLTRRLLGEAGRGVILAHGGSPGPIRRLVPLLLQFSTFNWLLRRASSPAPHTSSSTTRGSDQPARRRPLQHGAVGNLWERAVVMQRMLMAVALVLIAGIDRSGG
jgi:hypothetical protein